MVLMWMWHVVGHAREGGCLRLGREARVMALACRDDGAAGMASRRWRWRWRWRRGYGGEMRGMMGRGERARQGDTGEGMGKGLGGERARGHARVSSLCRQHTPADAGGVCTRADGWAAGSYLHLDENALVSLEANTFAGLTSLT